MLAWATLTTATMLGPGVKSKPCFPPPCEKQLTLTAVSSMTMPAPPAAAVPMRWPAANARCGLLLVTALMKLQAAYCSPTEPAASFTVVDSRRDLQTVQAERSMFAERDGLFLLVLRPHKAAVRQKADTEPMRDD